MAEPPIPSSSSTPVIEPFNQEARIAFGMMLEAHRKTSRERASIIEYQQMVHWLSEEIPSRGGQTEKEAKRRSWTRTHFVVRNRKLYRLADRTHPELREVISELQIWDTIIQNHNSLGHAGQDPTAKAINRAYYGITRDEVIFLIKLCEICHRKAPSKSKGPLKNIISTEVFERVQIDLIDMRSTPDVTTSGTFLWICHLLCRFCKIRMLIAMFNKEAATVARAIPRWICTFGVMKILQSDNGGEFKGVCLELARKFGVLVINGRPRTPRTQGLVEQSNGTVKHRINAWKRTNGSSHWSDSLDGKILFSSV